MQQTRVPLYKRLWAVVVGSSVVKFLIVGGLSFAIDLGTLALLHEAFRLDLWIATPIAFIISLLFNFAAQRSFTFNSTSRRDASFIKYVALVIVNTGATDIIVNVIAAAGLSYAIGKVVSTALTMTWNYFLYRHWVFKNRAKDNPLGASPSNTDAVRD